MKSLRTMEEIRSKVQQILESSQERIILGLFSTKVKNHNELSNDCNCEYCVALYNYIRIKIDATRIIRNMERYDSNETFAASFWKREDLRVMIEKARDYKNSLKEI